MLKFSQLLSSGLSFLLPSGLTLKIRCQRVHLSSNSWCSALWKSFYCHQTESSPWIWIVTLVLSHPRLATGHFHVPSGLAFPMGGGADVLIAYIHVFTFILQTSKRDLMLKYSNHLQLSNSWCSQIGFVLTSPAPVYFSDPVFLSQGVILPRTILHLIF